jgi:hypothetical protein
MMMDDDAQHAQGGGSNDHSCVTRTNYAAIMQMEMQNADPISQDQYTCSLLAPVEHS